MRTKVFTTKELNRVIRGIIALLLLVPVVFTLFISIFILKKIGAKLPEKQAEIEKLTQKNILSTSPDFWQPPESSTIPQGVAGELIKYGKNLIVNTSEYLGTQGSVAKMSNGMNCQNCHLSAGTKPFGNNYGAVASTYPKFRERSGTVETIAKRVNDCLQRSLNGVALDTTSREMQAIIAYITWLGKEVKKGTKPKGAGIMDLPFLDRAASPEHGKDLYERKCFSCHQFDGSGVPLPTGNGYQYPPLWGKNSYNNGAGLFRISRFAGYIKANMPWGASYDRPMLTDEEAWDIAAYVNSMPRPDVRKTVMKNDWKNIAGKPIDHPFAPFADSFSEQQHKFGPFKPIMEAKKNKK